MDNILSDDFYPVIDLKKTGIRLEKQIRRAGYSVNDIQNMLRLSCPQPVYRWLNGQRLPTVNHLYVLARMLNVHMEDLLAPICEMGLMSTSQNKFLEKRMFAYWACFRRLGAA